MQLTPGRAAVIAEIRRTIRRRRVKRLVANMGSVEKMLLLCSQAKRLLLHLRSPKLKLVGVTDRERITAEGQTFYIIRTLEQRLEKFQ